MRKIKFRAWFNGKKKMVYNLGFDEISFMEIDGKELSEDEMPAVWDKDTIVDDSYYEGAFSYEIMQYTGLKDKNGKDIYEGDILLNKGSTMYCSEYPMEIYFNEEFGGWMWRNKYTDEDGFFIDVAKKCEVVGNVYENPELLEVE